jgi:hypothetical protein
MLQFFAVCSTKTTVCCEFRNTLQQDSITQPKVGAQRLPWVSPQPFLYRNAVASLASNSNGFYLNAEKNVFILHKS